MNKDSEDLNKNMHSSEIRYKEDMIICNLGPIKQLNGVWLYANANIHVEKRNGNHTRKMW